MSAAQATSPFLEHDVLARMRGMRFAPRGRIEGTYSGRHASRQRGGATEFLDYREYTAGEDLRRLDWKVLARTGRPYVRLYQNETDLSCTLALDASASMSFAGIDADTVPGTAAGTAAGSKLQYMQYLATAISQLIYEQRDRVGLAVLGDRLGEVLPPAGTPSHLARVQDAIAALAGTGATDLGGSLRQLFPRLTRRGVLMLMSDFLTESLDPIFEAVRLFRHTRWEVVILHLIHPHEERLPDGPAYRFAGLEGEGDVDATPAEVRAGYAQAFDAHAASVRGLALASGCEYRRISTAVPYADVLQSFLIERAG